MKVSFQYFYPLNLDEDSETSEEDLDFIRKARKSLAMSHPGTLSADPENIPPEIAITAYESKESNIGEEHIEDT